MKKFLNIALVVAGIATLGLSCSKEPTNQTEAQNSYVYNDINTPIVWAGVEMDEDAYIIYLAKTEPASNVAPIDVEGLTITLPMDMLGRAGVGIGSMGVSVRLNDTELLGGTIEVAISGTTLRVDIANSDFNGNSLTANWNGVFANVEPDPFAVPKYDLTLKNQWTYSGDNNSKVPIHYAEFKVWDNGVYDGTSITLGNSDPINGDVTHGIALYMPSSKLGTEVIMQEDGETDSWSMDFWLNAGQVYYKGEGLDMKDIVNGKITMSRDGFNIDVKLAVVFSDGKILKANYSGLAADVDALDPIPATNQWAYNGLLSAVDVESVEYSAANESKGLGTFVLSNYDGFRLAIVTVPLGMLDGRDIPLVETSSYLWAVRYIVNNNILQQDAGIGMTYMTSGTVKVVFDRVSKQLSLRADIVYGNYIHFRINYNGNIAVPENISSIDELVGTWDVSETELVLSGGSFTEKSNNHVITITKVDASTIEIDNFTGYGAKDGRADKVRATINANNQMVIGAAWEFTPTWNASYTTALVPYITPVNQNVGTAFPAQSFVKTGKNITMTMKTGGVTIGTAEDTQCVATYVVAALQGGVYKNYFNIYADTFWRKRIE